MSPLSRKSGARGRTASRVLTSVPSVALFDAHLQPDGLAQSDLETLARFGVTAALLPAHAGNTRADAEALLAHFRDLSQVQAGRLLRAGIRPFLALGVPAGCAPPQDLDRVLDLLPETAGESRVVAIGLIGLGDGAPEAERLFARQLELAVELDLPAVIEVGSIERVRLLRRTLALLRESGIAPGRVLLARAQEADLKVVLGCGHLAGLSVRSGRVQPTQAVAAVRAYGPAQLVLGSDAGSGASDLLALPRTADALQAAGLSEPIVRRVTGENAAALLRVDLGALKT